jgi:hypothetical protein
MEEMTSAYKTSVRKSELKIPLGDIGEIQKLILKLILKM